MGYTFNVGPECEFFLFHTDENGHPTTHTNDEAGYFDLGPIDRGEIARRDICLALEDMVFRLRPPTMNPPPASMRLISSTPRPSRPRTTS